MNELTKANIQTEREKQEYRKRPGQVRSFTGSFTAREIDPDCSKEQSLSDNKHSFIQKESRVFVATSYV